jgi:hypothetical protein
MSEAKRFESGGYERSPAQRLVRYLQGHCADAIAKQRAELDRDDTSLHGTFIHRNLAQRTACFIMKPPHPHDSSGYMAKIHAVLPPSYVPAQFFDLDTSEITNFFVQKEVDGAAGPRWLVDETGVHSVEISEDIELDLPGDRNLPDDLTEQLLDELSSYNIVAHSEESQS